VEGGGKEGVRIVEIFNPEGLRVVMNKKRQYTY
jgi:hypothetical protein